MIGRCELSCAIFSSLTGIGSIPGVFAAADSFFPQDARRSVSVRASVRAESLGMPKNGGRIFMILRDFNGLFNDFSDFTTVFGPADKGFILADICEQAGLRNLVTGIDVLDQTRCALCKCPFQESKTAKVLLRRVKMARSMPCVA